MSRGEPKLRDSRWTMPPAARRAVEARILSTLAERFPGISWRFIRPRKRRQRKPPPSSR
jgi:hypothetical protein